MSFLKERDLKAKLLPWQHHSMRNCVSFSRYITGTKCHLQCINISRDILDFVVCLHTVTTDDVITCLLLTWISLEREKTLQQRKHHFIYILNLNTLSITTDKPLPLNVKFFKLCSCPVSFHSEYCTFFKQKWGQKHPFLTIVKLSQ